MQNISWNLFWTVIACSGVVYYLAVYLLNFSGITALQRKIVTAASLKARNETNVTLLAGNPAQGDPDGIGDYRKDQYQDAGSEHIEYIESSCLDEVTAYLEQCRKSKADKREVLLAIRRIITKYPALQNTHSKASLTSMLTVLVQDTCAIHLGEKDFAVVWS